MQKINRSFGFLLAKAEEEMEQRLIRELQPLEINARQFGALLMIEEHPLLSQKEIAEKLKIDRTTMVSQADYLENLGCIQRIRNPKDRRSYGLQITEKGREVIEKGWSRLQETEAQVLSSLTADEREQLKSLLMKVCGISTELTLRKAMRNPKGRI